MKLVLTTLYKARWWAVKSILLPS